MITREERMREGFILHDNILARVDNRKKAASCSTLNSHEEDTIKYCYQKCKNFQKNFKNVIKNACIILLSMLYAMRTIL